MDGSLPSATMPTPQLSSDMNAPPAPAPAETPGESGAGQTKKEPAKEGPLVLLVEDNPTNAKVWFVLPVECR